jgi:hypothetical protein
MGMKLNFYTEYVFYNPKTDRLIITIFSHNGTALWSAEKPKGVWVEAKVNLNFTGKHGYVLLGDLYDTN